MKAVVFVLIAGGFELLLDLVGLHDTLQDAITFVLPLFGYPLVLPENGGTYTPSPLPIAALFAYGFILNMRLTPLTLSLRTFGIWPNLLALFFGIGLLGKTQLLSGVAFDAWPSWPGLGDLAAGTVTILLGTLPPLTIAFFERRQRHRSDSAGPQ